MQYHALRCVRLLLVSAFWRLVLSVIPQPERLLCRILLGEVLEIKHLFMVPGHTMNLLDGRFGVIKKKCQDLTAYSRQQLLDALNALDHDRVEWVTIDDMLRWKSVLENFFVDKIPHISKYHSFHFSCLWPGKVKCKRREHDEPVIIDMLQPQYWDTCMPSQFQRHPDVIQFRLSERDIPPLEQLGMSRRAYKTLQDMVRPLIPAEYREELCPEGIPLRRDGGQEVEPDGHE